MLPRPTFQTPFLMSLFVFEVVLILCLTGKLLVNSSLLVQFSQLLLLNWVDSVSLRVLECLLQFSQLLEDTLPLGFVCLKLFRMLLSL